jgi:hypothetical protein
MDFNQILNKYGKKNLITAAIAVVALIFYCFASYITMSVEAMGRSQSEGAGLLADLFFEDEFGLISFVGIVTILAVIALVVTIFRGMKKESLYCAYAVAAAGILSLICAMIKAGDLEDKMGGGMGGFGAQIQYSVGAGWGLWIAVIGFVACAAVAHFLPEDNQQ